MALQPITLRIEPELLEAADREAAMKGVSRNKFIETAIAMRVAYSAARRGAVIEGFSELDRAAERFVRAVWDE